MPEAVETFPYRVTERAPRRIQKRRVKPGDTIQLTKLQAAGLRDAVELVVPKSKPAAKSAKTEPATAAEDEAKG